MTMTINETDTFLPFLATKAIQTNNLTLSSINTVKLKYHRPATFGGHHEWYEVDFIVWIKFTLST